MKSIVHLITIALFVSCGQRKEVSYPALADDKTSKVTSNESVQADTFSGDAYEAKKLSVEDHEKENPLDFLTVKWSARANMVNETVLEGSISSSATVASFKDVVLNVTFKTKTNTVRGSKKFTVYEFIRPGKSKAFKFKMRKTDKLSVTVESAKPSND